jgi:thioredoxin reductase
VNEIFILFSLHCLIPNLQDRALEQEPPCKNLSRYEGAGVYYGATFVEAQLCGGEEVIVVGGGNSAGQQPSF